MILEVGPDRLSRNVGNSISALHNIPEERRSQILEFPIFIVAPCILKSKASHSPTDALFMTLGKV
jgi:hypothetical protein